VRRKPASFIDCCIVRKMRSLEVRELTDAELSDAEFPTEQIV